MRGCGGGNEDCGLKPGTAYLIERSSGCRFLAKIPSCTHVHCSTRHCQEHFDCHMYTPSSATDVRLDSACVWCSSCSRRTSPPLSLPGTTAHGVPDKTLGTTCCTPPHPPTRLRVAAPRSRLMGRLKLPGLMGGAAALPSLNFPSGRWVLCHSVKGC